MFFQEALNLQLDVTPNLQLGVTAQVKWLFSCMIGNLSSEKKKEVGWREICNCQKSEEFLE